MKKIPLIFYITLMIFLCAITFTARIGTFTLGSLGYTGIKATLLLFWALILWIFELLPIAVTSLFVLILIPITGIINFTETIQFSFGDSILAFFLGVLIISLAFQETGLGRRIALSIFRLFGTKEKNILFGVMLSGAFLAMWVTEVGSVAIIYPIALAILNQQKENINKNNSFSKALMLGVAWGPAFGGVATPIATGANLVAIRYLEEYGNYKLGFVDWMIIGVPLMIMLVMFGWLLLSHTLNKENKTLLIDNDICNWTRKEIKLAIIFLITIILWLLGGIYKSWPLSSHQIALGAAILLFFPGIEVLEWEKIFPKINWSSIILICSGVALGKILFQTKVADWIAEIFFGELIMSRGVVLRSFLIVIVIAIIKIIFTSNTVAGVIMVPVMISLAQQYHLAPLSLVAPAIFSTALSLISITSSPVNVIPYASGCFTVKDMAKYGVLMTIISSLIIAIWLGLFLTN